MVLGLVLEKNQNYQKIYILNTIMVNQTFYHLIFIKTNLVNGLF